MSNRRSLSDRLANQKLALELFEVREKMMRLRLRAKAMKLHSRMLSTYGSARKDRTTADWRGPFGSADQAILPDDRTNNGRARELVRDHWMGASAAAAFRRRVGTGINVRSYARDPQTGKKTPLLEAYNRDVNFWWKPWSETPALCDVECAKNINQMQQLISQEVGVVGEAFGIFCYLERLDGLPGFKIQMFEPEQLDIFKMRNPENGNEIRGGVEVEPVTHRAVAYWVYVDGIDKNFAYWASPGGGAVSIFPPSQRVVAERCFHVVRPDRVRQVRGVTRLAPVMKKVWHASMYDEYQILAARGEALYGGMIESGDPEAGADFGVPASEGEEGGASKSEQEIEMVPGVIQRLKTGEKFTYYQPKRPGNQYQPFMDAQADHVGAGMDLDGPTLSRNFTRGSFSSQIQGQIESDKGGDADQMLVISHFLAPVRREFKRILAIEAQTPPPGFFSDPVMRVVYERDQYALCPKKWIVPSQQAGAEKIRVEGKMVSRGRQMLEQGIFFDEEMEEIGEEELTAKAAGATLPEDPAPGTTMGEPHGTYTRTAPASPVPAEAK